MTMPAHERDLPPTAASPLPPPAPVIDLREEPTTRVRVARDDNPFTALAPPERMRLIIRVLCELVAYDELDAGTAADHRRTLQATVADANGSSAPSSITG